MHLSESEEPQPDFFEVHVTRIWLSGFIEICKETVSLVHLTEMVWMTSCLHQKRKVIIEICWRNVILLQNWRSVTLITEARHRILPPGLFSRVLLTTHFTMIHFNIAFPSVHVICLCGFLTCFFCISYACILAYCICSNLNFLDLITWIIQYREGKWWLPEHGTSATLLLHGLP
jgi:hypothetical protein